MILDIEQGSQIGHMRSKLAEWLPYKLEILGTGGIVMPLLNNLWEPAGTTFKTMGDLQATFTWDRDVSNMLSYENGVPVVQFNGSSDDALSPDADAWSAGADGTAGNDPAISIGIWFYWDSAPWTGMLLGKANGSTLQEYTFGSFGGTSRWAIYDDVDTGATRIAAVQDSAPTGDMWHHMICTYGGGADESTCLLYIDGEAVSVTQSKGGSYTAMHNEAIQFSIGSRNSNDNFLDTKIMGSSLGPFFTNIALTADQARIIYQVEAKIAGLFQ